jgi:hypothetical protein
MPGLGRKFHYFRGIRSPCCKWMFGGQLDPDTGEPHKDDCALCARLRAAERASDRSDSGAVSRKP